MKLYVGITDADWFRYLRELNAEEINFWHPRATTKFKILEQGELFLFKSKYPENMIVGGAFLLGIQPSRLILHGKHLKRPTVCQIWRCFAIRFRPCDAIRSLIQ
jgi:hypothetical protein